MMMTARRLRSIGWIATLVVCAALVMVLAFRVNALRSQVHQSQARIIELKQETAYLETEFETRASQQQLKAWNDVEFGYVAPTAGQYLNAERELAAYAKPPEPGAPAPVRVASADDAAADAPAMVSPMTGKPMAVADSGDAAPARLIAASADGDDTPAHPARHADAGLTALGDKLATVHHAAPAHHAAKATTAKAKTAEAKPGHHAEIAKAHKPAAHDTRTAAATHHVATPGHAPVRLALKEAKAIK